jgi:hypothetical protein
MCSKENSNNKDKGSKRKNKMQRKEVVVKFLLERKKKKESDIHTKKWERCVKAVKKQNEENDTDYNPYAVCTDSIGYEGSIKKPHRQQDENINPKMSKSDLLEYISKRKNNVVKRYKKSDIISEQRRERDQYDFPRMNEVTGQERRDIMKYLEAIRESGVVNMFGAHPMLAWAPDDLHRFLYGMSKDIESLEDEIENLEYEGEDTTYKEEQLKTIKYLMDNKQKIRDILIRAAMVRADREDSGHDMGNIQRLFDRMAKEAWQMWVGLYGIN